MSSDKINFIDDYFIRYSQPWEKMVREKKMKGVQLFTGGPKSTIIKDYKILEIPRFILFDREGKIITIQAPAPSGKIKELLEKLDGMES